jgi:hypothetical protein
MAPRRVPDALQREAMLRRAGIQKIASAVLSRMGPGSAAQHWRAALRPGHETISDWEALALSFGHAPDLRAERIQPFVDALVAALDLVGVVDGGSALGADGREQHRHAGANVG